MRLKSAKFIWVAVTCKKQVTEYKRYFRIQKKSTTALAKLYEAFAFTDFQRLLEINAKLNHSAAVFVNRSANFTQLSVSCFMKCLTQRAVNRKRF